MEDLLRDEKTKNTIEDLNFDNLQEDIGIANTPDNND